MANYGFVYILNHDYMPDVYKIGFTDRAPLQRVQELSASTSVPAGFNLVYYFEFENANAIEKSIHSQLDWGRIDKSREFFHLEIAFVVENLIPSIKKGSINFCECNEYKNLLTKYSENLDSFYEDDESEALLEENEFTNEIVEKAAEVIASASSEKGDSDA